MKKEHRVDDVVSKDKALAVDGQVIESKKAKKQQVVTAKNKTPKSKEILDNFYGPKDELTTMVANEKKYKYGNSNIDLDFSEKEVKKINKLQVEIEKTRAEAKKARRTLERIEEENEKLHNQHEKALNSSNGKKTRDVKKQAKNIKRIERDINEASKISKSLDKKELHQEKALGKQMSSLSSFQEKFDTKVEKRAIKGQKFRLREEKLQNSWLKRSDAKQKINEYEFEKDKKLQEKLQRSYDYKTFDQLEAVRRDVEKVKAKSIGSSRIKPILSDEDVIKYYDFSKDEIKRIRSKEEIYGQKNPIRVNRVFKNVDLDVVADLAWVDSISIKNIDTKKVLSNENDDLRIKDYYYVEQEQIAPVPVVEEIKEQKVEVVKKSLKDIFKRKNDVPVNHSLEESNVLFFEEQTPAQNVQAIENKIEEIDEILSVKTKEKKVRGPIFANFANMFKYKKSSEDALDAQEVLITPIVKKEKVVKVTKDETSNAKPQQNKVSLAIRKLFSTKPLDISDEDWEHLVNIDHMVLAPFSTYENPQNKTEKIKKEFASMSNKSQNILVDEIDEIDGVYEKSQDDSYIVKTESDYEKSPLLLSRFIQKIQGIIEERRLSKEVNGIIKSTHEHDEILNVGEQAQKESSFASRFVQKIRNKVGDRKLSKRIDSLVVKTNEPSLKKEKKVRTNNIEQPEGDSLTFDEIKFIGEINNLNLGDNLTNLTKAQLLKNTIIARFAQRKSKSTSFEENVRAVDDLDIVNDAVEVSVKKPFKDTILEKIQQFRDSRAAKNTLSDEQLNLLNYNKIVKKSKVKTYESTPRIEKPRKEPVQKPVEINSRYVEALKDVDLSSLTDKQLETFVNTGKLPFMYNFVRKSNDSSETVDQVIEKGPSLFEKGKLAFRSALDKIAQRNSDNNIEKVLEKNKDFDNSNIDISEYQGLIDVPSKSFFAKNKSKSLNINIAPKVKSNTYKQSVEISNKYVDSLKDVDLSSLSDKQLDNFVSTGKLPFAHKLFAKKVKVVSEDNESVVDYEPISEYQDNELEIKKSLKSILKSKNNRFTSETKNEEDNEQKPLEAQTIEITDKYVNSIKGANLSSLSDKQLETFVSTGKLPFKHNLVQKLLTKKSSKGNDFDASEEIVDEAFYEIPKDSIVSKSSRLSSLLNGVKKPFKKSNNSSSYEDLNISEYFGLVDVPKKLSEGIQKQSNEMNIPKEQKVVVVKQKNENENEITDKYVDSIKNANLSSLSDKQLETFVSTGKLPFAHKLFVSKKPSKFEDTNQFSTSTEVEPTSLKSIMDKLPKISLSKIKLPKKVDDAKEIKNRYTLSLNTTGNDLANLSDKQLETFVSTGKLPLSNKIKSYLKPKADDWSDYSAEILENPEQFSRKLEERKSDVSFMAQISQTVVPTSFEKADYKLNNKLSSHAVKGDMVTEFDGIKSGPFSSLGDWMGESLDKLEEYKTKVQISRRELDRIEKDMLQASLDLKTRTHANLTETNNAKHVLTEAKKQYKDIEAQYNMAIKNVKQAESKSFFEGKNDQSRINKIIDRGIEVTETLEENKIKSLKVQQKMDMKNFKKELKSKLNQQSNSTTDDLQDIRSLLNGL